MESLSKSRIQGVWDPAHSTRVGIPPGGYQKLSTRLRPLSTRLCLHFTSGCRHFTSGCRRFHPDVLHPEICCHHSIRMFHIRNSGRVTLHILRMFHIRQTYLDGRIERFNFHDQAYPDPPTALARRVSQPILHSAAVFSWSFPICATDILRYFGIFWDIFALDICCLNPQNLLVTHQL